MNSDERKSYDYWMGVRDALRMIDRFVRFQRENPKKAKKIEDFITDGLISAAKKCQSCLSEELRVEFDEESHDVVPLSEPDEIPLFFEESALESTEPTDTPPDPSLEVSTMESEELSTSQIEPTSEEKISIEEDETEASIEIPPFFVEESILEDSESSTTTPRFSWDDHDDLTTASTKSSDTDIDSPEPEEPTTAKVRIWSPYDEPSVPESVSTSDSDSILKEDEDKAEESDLDISPSTSVEPPPPPPPPESDESEEERKRKARRLFFGT